MFHFPGPLRFLECFLEPITRRLDNLGRQSAAILERLKIMASTQADADRMLADIKADQDVFSSALTAIEGANARLAAAVEAAVAAHPDVDLSAVLDALAVERGLATRVAEAIVAGTPAETAPTDPAAPVEADPAPVEPAPVDPTTGV